MSHVALFYVVIVAHCACGGPSELKIRQKQMEGNENMSQRVLMESKSKIHQRAVAKKEPLKTLYMAELVQKLYFCL